MLQIEWKSSLYHSDGRRRSRPKPSTVHGWLVKWRATFSGNERLRKEGIREMREAKAVREWKRKKRAARDAKGGASKPLFCLGPISLGKKRRPQVSRISQRSVVKSPRRNSTKHLTSSTQSPGSTRINSRRSSRNRQGANGHTPRSSRKGSYDNRGNTVRAAERNR